MAGLIGTRELYRGWLRLEAVTLETDGGAVIMREVEDHGRAVSALVYDPDRRTALLVRQLRAGPVRAGEVEPRLLEAPAGMIDAGETAEAAARREVWEEIGVRADTLRPVGRVYSCPGISTETVALFLAPCPAADRVGGGGGLAAEHEEIEVVEMGLAELAALSDAGGLLDMKTVLLVSRLRLEQPGLFARP